MEAVVIRKARPAEAPLLSQLAFRSKSFWGYSPKFMESCRAELTVDASRIDSGNHDCRVAVSGTAILGFYTLERLNHGAYELEALFVDPGHIGTGVGRMLIEHAIEALSGHGASRLIIQGDPNARRFYIAAGARQVGTRESQSIPGRQLPLFEIIIEAK